MVAQDFRGRPQRYVRTSPVALDGTAEASFTAPNGILHITHVRVTIDTTQTDPNQALATLLIDGIEWESTNAGNSDQTDSTQDLISQQVLTCTWTGATPGRTATMIIRGFQED